MAQDNQVRESAVNVKVMEIERNADPAVLWLRARQLCYLGGSCTSERRDRWYSAIEDDVPADLADGLKADEVAARPTVRHSSQ